MLEHGLEADFVFTHSQEATNFVLGFEADVATGGRREALVKHEDGPPRPEHGDKVFWISSEIFRVNGSHLCRQEVFNFNECVVGFLPELRTDRQPLGNVNLEGPRMHPLVGLVRREVDDGESQVDHLFEALALTVEICLLDSLEVQSDVVGIHRVPLVHVDKAFQLLTSCNSRRPTLHFNKDVALFERLSLIRLFSYLFTRLLVREGCCVGHGALRSALRSCSGHSYAHTHCHAHTHAHSHPPSAVHRAIEKGHGSVDGTSVVVRSSSHSHWTTPVSGTSVDGSPHRWTSHAVTMVHARTSHGWTMVHSRTSHCRTVVHSRSSHGRTRSSHGRTRTSHSNATSHFSTASDSTSHSNATSHSSTSAAASHSSSSASWHSECIMVKI